MGARHTLADREARKQRRFLRRQATLRRLGTPIQVTPLYRIGLDTQPGRSAREWAHFHRAHGTRVNDVIRTDNGKAAIR